MTDTILYKDIKRIPSAIKNGVVSLGNFDGVHRGHQAVIGNAKVSADKLSVSLVVLTFVTHPRLYFNPDAESFEITPLNAKLPYMKALGVSGVVALDFAKIKNLTAREFIQTVLIDGLNAKIISVGYDFKFGKDRSGCVETLLNDDRFETVVTMAQSENTDTDNTSEIFSSTKVRNYVRNGDVSKASQLLGRPFEIYGVVEHGQKLGRTIGFPTANISFLKETLRPKYGVYAVRLGIEENGVVTWHNGAGNFGVRPSMKTTKEVLEVHLFDFSQDIYNKKVRIAMIEYIRPEKFFKKIEELKNAIEEDCNIIRRIHSLRSSGA